MAAGLLAALVVLVLGLGVADGQALRFELDHLSLPVAAGLLRSGAGVGTMVAFLTGWSLWAVGRIPMEVGVLGWKFTLIRAR